MPIHEPIDRTLQVPFVVVHEVDVLNVVNNIASSTIPGLVNAVPRFRLALQDGIGRLLETRQWVPTLTTNTDGGVI
jgi:hypothetical protein